MTSSRTTLRIAIAIALAIFGPGRSAGLDANRTLTQYAHRIWGQEEGLFQPTIYSIDQTKDGFLWLGTQDSLIRFDGIHFREFTSANNEALHHTLIRALTEDPGGNLWVASIGAGLARITPGGTLTRFTTKDGLPSDSVFCVLSTADGALWACTNQGLAELRNGRFRVYTTADGLPTNQIRSSCESPNGTRWVTGLDFGLMRWDGKRFTPYNDPGLSPKENVTALDCAKDGTVWLGTATGLKHITANKMSSLTVADGLPDNSVSAITESPDGSIWIGTDTGVSRYRAGEMSAYRTRDGLSHSLVLSLFVDREGSLWAGTKDGLDQFTDGKVTPFTTNEGLLSNDVGPVIEDAAGRLWVGTVDRGLNVFENHRWQPITTREGLTNNSILSLETGNRDELWVGTANGLNKLRDGKVIRRYGPSDGLSGREVRAIFFDRQGTLWAGTNAGLDRLSGDQFSPSGVDGLSSKSIVSLAGGGLASLFVSTEDSFFFASEKNRLNSYPLSVVRPVDAYYLNSRRHSVWMGTLGSGLLRWRNGSVSHIWVKDGLYDNRIYGIVADGQRNLWMASSKGIFRIGEDELEDFADGKVPSITSIPFSTGQLRFECQSGVQPAACRTRDGRLWFSTASGLVVVDPNHLESNRIQPPAQITAVIINGQRRDPHGAFDLKPWEHGVVEIRYAGLSFVSPEKVAFRYILDGYDRVWTDAGTRREAFFTNLPPGHFSFRVLARNADGVWSSRPALLYLTIEPRLYQQPWFFPLAALLLGATITAWYRARVRKLQLGFDLVLAERTRIARELHDTLLQGLSGITMQLQALWTRLPVSKEKNLLADIIGDAGRATREARRSLWGLRDNGSEPVSFRAKLEKVARQAVSGKPVTLVLQFDPVDPALPPALEFEILRIAGEAIANALRHSQARRLAVGFHSGAGHLNVIIEDDGVGFSTSGSISARGHFGLLGMRERAEEIEADLAITSEPGRGTRIALSVPIPASLAVESNPGLPFEHQL